MTEQQKQQQKKKKWKKVEWKFTNVWVFLSYATVGLSLI